MQNVQDESKRQKTLLETIRNYKGLSILGEEELNALCCEIRDLILKVTLKNGGHLGGSLGAVELCVALLRVFDPERDKLVFDVGHQTYAYKILTDRLDRFSTLRTKGGISGFPRRSESKYDAFDVGHSSTSISAALGFAKSRDLLGQDHDVVAVIGDGSLLNGLALEGLNNIAACNSKITVILNDNEMSISPRVGGFAEHLAKLSVSTPYQKLKQFVKDQCRKMNEGERYEDRLGNIKTKLKSLLLPTNAFEAMGISYWGPFDGHQLQELEEIFELSKQYPRPLLIHVVTRKGKGCAEAETMPSTFHGIGAGSVLLSLMQPPASPPADWSQAVADNISSMAETDRRVVALTAAMEDGCRLSGFKREYPERFFDVGIAEGHMLTYAAGLAAGGLRPVACVYSTFLQRAMDQIVHDISMQRHGVLIAVDRSGLNGEDGETHQGLLDMAWGKSVPGLVIGAPRDKVDLAFMMKGWLDRGIPMMIRYPKGKAPESIARREGDVQAMPWARAEVLSNGSELCLFALGSTVPIALDTAAACEEAGFPAPSVVDLRFISPLDWETIDELLEDHANALVIEDGYLAGGVGEAIAARSASNGFACCVRGVGVDARYVAHASRAQQMETFSLTTDGVLAAIAEFYTDDRIQSAASG